MAGRQFYLDPFKLERFVEAQKPVWTQVREELAAGAKRTHWMWFIFPQIQGLGSSFMAQRFAISNLKEARAYLAHPLLGSRLREATELVRVTEGRTVHEIFGTPDDLKFHSSMTLFAAAAGEFGGADAPYRGALERFFEGALDEATVRLL